MFYSTDTDLLGLEPNLFHDAAFASQLLSSGSGNLAGTAFTRSTGSFADDHVTPGCVLSLAGDLAGGYPIIAVPSATVLTVSTFHETLFADPALPNPSPIGTAAAVAFTVRTFAPQRQIVADLIRGLAGVGPGTPLPDAVLIPTPTLRHAAALGAFQLIYSALAASAAEPADLQRRADYYERLYRRALARLCVDIDTDGDGKADRYRLLCMAVMFRT